MTDQSAFQSVLHQLRSEYEIVLTSHALAKTPNERQNVVVNESYDSLASQIQGALLKLGRSETCDKNNVASWFGRGALPGHPYLLAMLEAFFNTGHVGALTEEEFIHSYNVTAQQRGRAPFRPSMHRRASYVQRWRSLVFPAMDRLHLIPLFIQAEPSGNSTFDDLIIGSSNRRLLVAQPEWFCKLADQSGIIANTTNVDFNGDSDWSEFESRYGFLGLDRNSITKEAESVANFFANDMEDRARTYKIYNRPKLGVFGLNFIVPSDGPERQAVRLSLFETDYFSHKIFQSLIAKSIVNRPDLFRSLDSYPVIEDRLMNYFMTSLGINVNLISTYAGTRRLILGRLSNNNMHIANRGKFHLIANEGVNLDDMETNKDGKQEFSFTRALKRCLDEEVGLPPDRIRRVAIDGLFIVRENFELGIHLIVETDASPEDITRYRTMARDARREMRSELSTIELTYGGLSDFVENQAGGLDKLSYYLPTLLDALIIREERRRE